MVIGLLNHNTPTEQYFYTIAPGATSSQSICRPLSRSRLSRWGASRQRNPGEKMSEVKNKAKSKQVASCIDAQLGQCFRACTDLIFYHASEVPNAFYVEGWATRISAGLRFGHAWLSMGGEIVDPVAPEEDLKYEETGRLTQAELSEHCRTKRRELPFFNITAERPKNRFEELVEGPDRRS
jgi:hypothetical protein